MVMTCPILCKEWHGWREELKDERKSARRKRENIQERDDGTCKGPVSGRGNGINDRVARVQSSR